MIRIYFLWAALAYFICAAERLIESKSLNPCMDNSQLAAKFFATLFTPDNRTLTFTIEGDSKITSNVTLEMEVLAYGHLFLKQVLDPCDSPGLKGICPMRAGSLPGLNSNIVLDQKDVVRIPSKFSNRPRTCKYSMANHRKMLFTSFQILMQPSECGSMKRAPASHWHASKPISQMANLSITSGWPGPLPCSL